MKISVIVDTNKLHSKSFEYLLGARDHLEHLTDKAKLVLPRMVLEELISQRRREFKKQINALRENTLVKHAGILETIDTLDFNEIERRLREDKTIPYELIELPSSSDLLEVLMDMALANLPPFDVNSDRGFKDACIAKTVDAYAAYHPEESIFFLTDDKRLMESFTKELPVRLLEDYEELWDALGRMDNIEECSDGVAPTLPGWLKESVAKKKRLIEQLRSSLSFSSTHSVIRELDLIYSQLNRKDALELFSIALENTQVSWILHDFDLRDFYGKLFTTYKSYLDAETYREFCDLLKHDA